MGIDWEWYLGREGEELAEWSPDDPPTPYSEEEEPWGGLEDYNTHNTYNDDPCNNAWADWNLGSYYDAYGRAVLESDIDPHDEDYEEKIEAVMEEFESVLLREITKDTTEEEIAEIEDCLEKMLFFDHFDKTVFDDVIHSFVKDETSKRVVEVVGKCEEFNWKRWKEEIYIEEYVYPAYKKKIFDNSVDKSSILDALKDAISGLLKTPVSDVDAEEKLQQLIEKLDAYGLLDQIDRVHFKNTIRATWDDPAKSKDISVGGVFDRSKKYRIRYFEFVDAVFRHMSMFEYAECIDKKAIHDKLAEFLDTPLTDIKTTGRVEEIVIACDRYKLFYASIKSPEEFYQEFQKKMNHYLQHPEDKGDRTAGDVLTEAQDALWEQYKAENPPGEFDIDED